LAATGGLGRIQPDWSAWLLGAEDASGWRLSLDPPIRLL
jgi:hypothetical protein